LAALFALLVGFGHAFGFRREFWLHPESFADAVAGAQLVAFAVFCAAFLVLFVLRSRL